VARAVAVGRHAGRVYAPPGARVVVVAEPGVDRSELAAFDEELEQPAARIPVTTRSTPSDLNDTGPLQQSSRSLRRCRREDDSYCCRVADRNPPTALSDVERP
jgi:hypothetical protein